MTGSTLIVSREVNLHAEIKKMFEGLGFRNVTVTAAEKDGLNMLIDELKPGLVIVESGFYKSATPYMMALLKRRFRDLNIAAVSICDYPADLAMKFIANGINSFLSYLDGRDQFYRGLEKVRDGGVLSRHPRKGGLI
jgi:hypothetical protein